MDRDKKNEVPKSQVSVEIPTVTQRTVTTIIITIIVIIIIFTTIITFTTIVLLHHHPFCYHQN
jgi:hypothetical protein